MLEDILTTQWLRSTVLIERQVSMTEVSRGTGVFVHRTVGPGGRVQTYLVTNKHVLGPQRSFGQSLILNVNVSVDGFIQPYQWNVEYTTDDFRNHPNANVDVCAIHVSLLIVETPNLSYAAVDYDSMAFESWIRRLDIRPGDEVISLGYPLGYSQGVNNLPILRQGVLATSLLYNLGAAEGQATSPVPAFLVDGGVVHGSSGSPLFLKPVPARLLDGAYQLGNTLPFFIGIMSKTHFATIPDNEEPTYAGLGVAFRAETVRETVEQFYL